MPSQQTAAPSKPPGHTQRPIEAPPASAFNCGGARHRAEAYLDIGLRVQQQCGARAERPLLHELRPRRRGTRSTRAQHVYACFGDLPAPAVVRAIERMGETCGGGSRVGRGGGY